MKLIDASKLTEQLPVKDILVDSHVDILSGAWLKKMRMSLFMPVSRKRLADAVGVDYRFVEGIEDRGEALLSRHVDTWANVLGVESNRIRRWCSGEVTLSEVRDAFQDKSPPF